MSNEPVRVTAFDPATGETATQDLDPHGYILLLGEHMEVSSLARYGNGTIQFTIKRTAGEQLP